MIRFLQGYLLLLTFLASLLACDDQSGQTTDPESTITGDSSSVATTPFKTGAEQLITENLELIQGKKVAVVANHTSMVGNVHLVDTLLGLGIDIIEVFAPEHGFRGATDAGAKIDNTTDPQTGLPILSLYGKSRKPSVDQLTDVDVVVFDIQDVGSRHYTYISTMTYVMEACAEQNKMFVVLDRPNPNGWYVDGPMMQDEYKSFIGIHNVPIVHGMTIGEYAQLVNGEYWLKDSVQANLKVITCQGYHHQIKWDDTGLPWIAPSPNLASEYAAYLYPALCWFEPTVASIGRGTDEAFTILGAPWVVLTSQARLDQMTKDFYGLTYAPYTFTPRSLPGKSTYPKFQDQTCKGLKFQNRVKGKQLFLAGIKLLQFMNNQFKSEQSEGSFFKSGFEKWSGNTTLRQQIQNNLNPEDIWLSWQPDVNNFKEIRKQYLLYNDFE